MQGKTIRATEGETIKVTNQWAAETEKRGTTVSTSTWTFTGSGTTTGAALSGTNASVLLTPTSNGTLVNTATLANGETLLNTRPVVLGVDRPMDYV